MPDPRYDIVVNNLKALANPQRFRILLALLEHPEQSVTQLLTKTSISQSALSQHLALLRKNDVVSTRRDAQMVFYAIKDTQTRHVLSSLKDIYLTS